MVVCMASLQRSIHGQKVCCQVEGWQNINDFENVLGGPSMNMIIIILKWVLLLVLLMVIPMLIVVAIPKLTHPIAILWH
jgi:hypothetical protein